MFSTYRPLTDAEVQQLEAQRCRATDWSMLRVHPDFCAANVEDVTFEGRHYLGRDVVLRRVAHLVSTGDSQFANGQVVEVMKEDGGLDVVIYDGLSSMEAAMAVMERDAADIQQQLRQRAEAYAATVRCDGCVIADGVTVEDVRMLRDVRLGQGARVAGAYRLSDVSLVDSPAAPVSVGDGVVLDSVIVGAGSAIVDGAQLDHCFVGQACHIGRMFSATQSLFFANCHFENGEACALFAGPYSVSHHKATLLIACQLSFFNAGSGSNQSNHSYKMGPNKWGQLERGSKLGSSSYLYWPARIGAFTTVTGHHTMHADLRQLPFSLIVEGGQGRTVIAPGHALASVGTRRDAVKWPKRDHRNAEAGITDLIDFSLFNPFTVGRIRQGIAVLMQLVDSQTPVEVVGQREGQRYYEWNGCLLGAEGVAHGLERYQQAVEIYLGQQVRARQAAGLSLEGQEVALDEWQDYGGMVVPRQEALALLAQGITFEQMQPYMAEFAWNWAAQCFCDFYGKTPAECSAEELADILAHALQQENQWQAALDADGERDLKAAQG